MSGWTALNVAYVDDYELPEMAPYKITGRHHQDAQPRSWGWDRRGTLRGGVND